MARRGQTLYGAAISDNENHESLLSGNTQSALPPRKTSTFFKVGGVFAATTMLMVGAATVINGTGSVGSSVLATLGGSKQEVIETKPLKAISTKWKGVASSSSSSFSSSAKKSATATKKKKKSAAKKSNAVILNKWARGDKQQRVAQATASLGEEAGSTTMYLGTGCSNLDKLKFELEGDFTEAVGARLVSKSMSNDFLFEKGIEMTQTSCGEFEVNVPTSALAQGEEFGFFLYSKQTPTDENEISDIGCGAGSADPRCPAAESPALLANMACATPYTSNGNTFFNRVWDGSQTSFQWGSCETTCSQRNEHCELESNLPDPIVAMYGDDYTNDGEWHNTSPRNGEAGLGFSCSLSSDSTFDADEEAFHFDYSQASLLKCPLDISPSKYHNLTIEMLFKLDDDYNAGQTKAWIIGHDDHGYDRSLILSDERYGGMGQGIGGTYTSGISSPSVGVYHHAIATFAQGVAGGSFVTLDGQFGAHTTASNGNGVNSYTIGGLQNFGAHGIKGFVKAYRIYDVAFTDEMANDAYDEVKNYLASLNEDSEEADGKDTNNFETDFEEEEDDHDFPWVESAFSLIADEYDGSSTTWSSDDSDISCTLGSTTTYSTETGFHFDYAQSSNIICPFDLSPSKNSDLTIEIVFRLDDDFDGSKTNGWIVGHDNGGYDRSLVLSDTRYGGMGQGVGYTYGSGLSTPENGKWHHAISTFMQGQNGGSFVMINGKVGPKVTANNNDGNAQFTIGGLQNYANHGIKGSVYAIRIHTKAYSENYARKLYEDIKEDIDAANNNNGSVF